MKEIDVYDFDKTIVPFDSGSLFCVYCFVHYPWTVLILPLLAIGGMLTLCRVISFTSFKRLCFLFTPFIPLKKAVKGFWDKYDGQVNKWFYDRPRHTVVISASPDFLLEEIHKRLGFEDLICTRHSKKTGAIIGENCRDEEKVRRLFELYDRDNIKVIDVYSDSFKHDKPIFSLGENCFHIVNGERIPFKFGEVYK